MAGWLDRWSKKRQTKLDQEREMYETPDDVLKEELTSLLPEGSTVCEFVQVSVFSPREQRNNIGFWHLAWKALLASESNPRALNEDCPTWLMLTENDLFRVRTSEARHGSCVYGTPQKHDPSVIGPVTEHQSEHFIGFGGGTLFVPTSYLNKARRVVALAETMAG